MTDSWKIDKKLPPFNGFDTRDNFVKTWITESPEGIPNVSLANNIESIINDILNFTKMSSEYQVEELGNSLKKLEMRSIVYYWYESNGKMLIGAEFEKRPQALIVRQIGKFNKGHPPFASDLYDAVLNDRKQIDYTVTAIRIISDDKLSEEGLRIWERLLQQGHKIMVYDSLSPGQTHIQITTLNQLQSFFKMSDPTFSRYQYVISESSSYGDLMSIFNLRKIHEIHQIL
jgi:hypothetical protein